MEKIKKLKEILRKNYIEGYIIPKNDEFFGEYISSNKDRLKYISNFSGSYGFALILNNKNFLFVDGRYTLQANKQSPNSFKIKTIPGELPRDILKNKIYKIGYDPKLFTKKTLKIFFEKTKCKYIPLSNNLIDEIWKRKKNELKRKFYILPENSVGENYKSKINKISSAIKKNNAWLLNIRGKDSLYSPVPNSYILIDQNKNVNFFCDLKKITSSFKKKFNRVKFIDINNVEEILLKIKKKKFIIDHNTCSIYFENIILKNNKIINKQDSIYFLFIVFTYLILCQNIKFSF